MARIRLFPHERTPSLGELLGSSQAEHQVTRKRKIRIMRDPLSLPTTTEPWAAHGDGSGRKPRTLARFFGRLLG